MIGPCEILLVDDSGPDVRLFQEVIREFRAPYRLRVARDGVEALLYLSKTGHSPDHPRPHIIVLDLNLPKMNGHDVLAEVKRSPDLRLIPVLVFSSSIAPSDVERAYASHANCYLQKPQSLDGFYRVMAAIETFWLGVASLPA